ncbi:MAG: hypothetical protein JW953_01540 [Anaerolineae bacterium]|nr:hypothetical protein [Anaerolineae bacterium]
MSKKEIKLKFVGDEGDYVQGYPRRDITVDNAAEAERLVETNCYELEPNRPPQQKEKNNG